jgi:hypothetical protein
MCKPLIEFNGEISARKLNRPHNLRRLHKRLWRRTWASNRVFAKSLTLFGLTVAAALLAPAITIAKPPFARIIDIRIDTHRAVQSTPLPPHFLGLSIEYSSVSSFMHKAGNHQRLFVQMMNNLTPLAGAPVLRIGGNSEDVSVWNLPDDKPSPPHAKFDITNRFIRDLKGVQQRTQCPLILGLNLACNRPALAAQWVQVALQRFPEHSIMAFEIGNEPDGFASWDHYRPKTWGFHSYIKDFNTYVKAIHYRVGFGVPLAGPAFCCRWLTNKNYASNFISLEHDNLAVATYHYYPLVQSHLLKPSAATYPSIRHLLAPSSSSLFSTLLEPAIQTAKSYSIPVRWGEANSCNDGGKNGISNVMASALWSLDTLFEADQAGASGVNFHMGGWYGAFAFYHHRLVVHPLYYALWIFAHAMQKHARLIPITRLEKVGIQRDHLVKIWASRDRSGIVRVVVINKHLRESARVNLRLSASRLGYLQVFSAPSASSTNGLRFGGMTFDGTTTGQPVGHADGTVLASRNHSFAITIKPASAVLLTCR